MKKNAIIGIGIVVVLALVATVALAWGPGSGPGFGRGFGGPGNGVPPIPNLTADQSAQIQALRDAFAKEIEPIQQNLFAKQTELRSLWSSPNPDEGAILAKQNEINALRSQLQEKATNLRFEIRKVLTPEQLAQMPGFNQGAGYGPGPGFGPRGCGGPMGMGRQFGAW